MQERGNRGAEGERYQRGDMTLQEVADLLGITRQRVQQIETLALKKIKIGLMNDPEFWRLIDDFESVDVLGKKKV
jgi:DNA-directed RNA polymerase sigma subunit (sigma70/sigma32)